MRLVTVLGPGGVGKTRLALELAHRLAGDFRDGARFVPLAAIDTRERLEQELELDDAGVELLLVLDNFEQLVNAAPVVADLLARAPGVTVLVTSQAALRLSGEHEVPLAPLAVGRGGRAVRRSVPARSTAPTRRSRRSARGSTACRWRSSWPRPAPGCSPRPRSSSGSGGGSTC